VEARPERDLEDAVGDGCVGEAQYARSAEAPRFGDRRRVDSVRNELPFDLDVEEATGTAALGEIEIDEVRAARNGDLEVEIGVATVEVGELAGKGVPVVIADVPADAVEDPEVVWIVRVEPERNEGVRLDAREERTPVFRELRAALGERTDREHIIGCR